MPASICDPVSSALRLSLANDDSQSSSLLDSRIYSSAKSVLLSKIEFEESGDYQSNVLDGLKSKYVVIRPKKPMLENKLLKKDGNSCPQLSETKNGEDGLPRPKRVLFGVEKVQLGWQGSWSAGAGMQNVGNTCYLNSTLQALFHVPALANWLVSESGHAEMCNQQEACVICGMRASLMATQKSGGSPVKPWQVYSKLRLICRHLTPGRQEDAHEFLRYLVEAMEKCYLSRFVNSDKLDQYSKETTPLNQILGGYLRSTVRCLACQHLSTTYQHFQDLLLDIRKHSTLDEALDSFFSRERLEDLGYKCEACNKKVSATKQFFVERAPMVLCIALKRFSLVGGKLSKHVQFRKKISLAKYMHNKNTHQQLSYKLVSMVTHLGPSQNCGHYTAIGQAPNGNYYQFDDSCVRPLPLSAVLGTNAYIMFFEKDNTCEDMTSMASTSSAVYGPQLPSNLLNKDKSPMKRDRSPLKLTFYRSEERQATPAESTSKEVIDKKSDVKQSVILNSTLCKPESSRSYSEPIVVKQIGEVEKVNNISNFMNGILSKEEEEKKASCVIKRSSDENGKKNGKMETNSKPTSNSQRSPQKITIGSKLVKPSKSPLEKLKDQMTKNGEIEGNSLRNGNGVCTKLVPYDSESSSDAGRDEKCSKKENGRTENSNQNGNSCWTSKPTRGASPKGLVVTTKGMHHAWTVSSEKNTPLLSPSLNGDTNKKLNKEDSPVNGNSPNTSVSTLSPISADSPTERRSKERSPVSSRSNGGGGGGGTGGGLLASAEALRSLHGLSHRGYGAPVSSWAGTHSQINKQVMEERRDERKRAHEDIDDMDRGRVKKVKKFHHYNRFNNDRNGYNPFQDKQNKQNWSSSGGSSFKYRNERRPSHHFHNKHYNNKYKRFNNRYSNNGHHYPRHH